MEVLLLALIGLPVGFALDSLVTRFASAPPDEEEAEPEPPMAMPEKLARGEAGSLVLTLEQPGHEWVRRLLITGATVGLFAIAGARYTDVSHLPIVTAYVCVLLVCASTDIISFRVPNAVTYPAILCALVVGAAMPDAQFLEVVAGGLLAGGVLLVPSIMTGGVGMGMGDVKLAAFAGLALGFENVVPAMLFMALSGGAVAALLLLTRARKKSEPIPYAPFISGGALLALLWQGAAFVDLV